MTSEVSAAPVAGIAERETVGRAEFARLLGVSIPTLDRMRDALPPPLDLGIRRVLWSRAAVLAFIRGK